MVHSRLDSRGTPAQDPHAPGPKTQTQPGDVAFISRTGERRFNNPIEIISAHTVGAVLPALSRVQAAVERGLHVAGFLAYESAPAFDSVLAAHACEAVPYLWFGLYDGCEVIPVQAETLSEFEVGTWTALVSESEYRNAVGRVREWIAAGDTYQVNYTFPMSAPFRGCEWSWFRRLCRAQQADYCAFVDAGRFAILSASPELFFRLDDTTITTRPMKGTRPRGRWSEEDHRLAQDLAGSAKEQAENVMIVDLLRNDLGRISTVGSVTVPRLFEVERYETVWQMTSTITARTSGSLLDIFGALFPSGSVTGAPKVRTMQIIRDLEPFPRGVYCGSVGWCAPDRQAEFNVAIRTVTLDRQTGLAQYHVGSAITWGSSPEAEYEECRVKASVLTYDRPAFELLESILFDGEYFLLEEHLNRLKGSADYFGFALDVYAVRSALADAADRWNAPLGRPAHQPLKVRLLVNREGGFRIESEPAKPSHALRVGLAAKPVDEQDVFLYHKTTRRAVYDEARASRPDCDDVILWNRRGEITESTIANVVLEIGGERLTPPLDCGLLPGTLRARLLARGEVREAALTRSDLDRAQAVWLINSVRKWVPARLVP